jgi:benzoyl-CoA reductase/2-hydroxyglutaryl-CoA dehydratase subunit BcrC/BadD/HgdB
MTEDKSDTDPEQEKRKIKSVKRMKEIMTAYYIEAKTPKAQTGRKIAWITSGGPVEPLIAMDVIPIYPENHGAMIGASRMGGDLCGKAETMGYAGDLCSYARADIACSTVNGGPIGGLPEPDMLICCNNICGTVLKWYEVQARRYNVPLFILDTPVCHQGFSLAARNYIERQMAAYIAFLEYVCGKACDSERLMDAGMLSLRAQELWQRILDACRHKPAPMSCFDAFFHLALIVTLRGTQIVVDYYEQLLAELKQRIADGIGMVPDEKYRLLWDNIPIWHKTRWLSEKFAACGACLVADTYTSAWSGSLKYLRADDLTGSMAEAYARIFLNCGTDIMAANIIQMARDYDVDGLVIHSNRSCKPYSLGQYDIQHVFQKELGLPSVIIEADMTDERQWAEAQIETRIDVFLEMLKASKN